MSTVVTVHCPCSVFNHGGVVLPVFYSLCCIHLVHKHSRPRANDLVCHFKLQEGIPLANHIFNFPPCWNWLTCSLVWQISVRGPLPLPLEISFTVWLSSAPLSLASESIDTPRLWHFSARVLRKSALFSPMPPAKTRASTSPPSLT